MAFTRRLGLGILVVGIGIALGCGQPNGPTIATEVPIELKLVKSSELEAAIQAQKGKIVVVDFWATWCGPCKKEFPRLVALHERFHQDGVACLSVSVDEEPNQEDALAFLREHQARFPNYLLNEDATAWQDHWRIKGVPVVFVYGRDGQRVQKFDKDDPDNQFTYADVTKLVERLVVESK